MRLMQAENMLIEVALLPDAMSSVLSRWAQEPDFAANASFGR